MELSQAAAINFPPGAAPVGTLRKWYGGAMAEDQLQLLESLIVIGPEKRLTARAALASNWLNEAVGRSDPRSLPRPGASTAVVSRPSSRQLAVPPAAAQKPRVRKAPSPQASSNAPRGYAAAPLVGISVAPAQRRVETPPPEVEAEMVESMADMVESMAEELEDMRPARSSRAGGDASTVSDAMEESIPEEIHTPRPSQESYDEIVRSGPPSRASSRPPSVARNPRACSSPPLFRMTPQPVGLVRKARPALSAKVPSSLRRE